MTFHHIRLKDEPQGQATFGMANLRSERTGLPFIVFISQRDDAKHAVRVKVSPDPKVRHDQMGSYALKPCRHVGGYRLDRAEEKALNDWIEENLDTLIKCWNGELEYTEDAIDLCATAGPAHALPISTPTASTRAPPSTICSTARPKGVAM